MHSAALTAMHGHIPSRKGDACEHAPPPLAREDTTIKLASFSAHPRMLLLAPKAYNAERA